MAKVRILSIKQIKLNTSGITLVKLPQTGFTISIPVDRAHAHLLEDKKTLKSLESVAEKAYKKFLLETAKRLQKFEKLFAGMLAKSAPEQAVARQISNLKQAMEKEVPKWEKAAEKEVLAALAALAKKKR